LLDLFDERLDSTSGARGFLALDGHQSRLILLVVERQLHNPARQ
jgi:hypothetical protein